jgi:cellulase/cellobiase CelA1
VNQWQGGFQAEVRITNTSTSTVNGWTVRWSFSNGQQITQIWNALQVTSGAFVAATNMSYNGTIAASASVTFGFLGSWTTANAKPGAFSLNGTTCTVA